jgi:hypothetical protein
MKNLIIQTPPEVLLKVADLCDGWGIFKPQTFIDMGLDPAIVSTYTCMHLSDADDPKQQITNKATGKQVEAMKGVYGLDLLRAIAKAFEIEDAPYSGRGKQARFYQEELKKKLGDLE